jgi:hypothetical protein
VLAATYERPPSVDPPATASAVPAGWVEAAMIMSGPGLVFRGSRGTKMADPAPIIAVQPTEPSILLSAPMTSSAVGRSSSSPPWL